MTGYVGAAHEFHDADFVQGWADRFVPTPSRLALFDLILQQISVAGLDGAHVVELGLGPGYMARHLLERAPRISYEGVDFSTVFFDVARKTLGRHLSRVVLTKADLTDRTWPRSLARQPAAVISTWALHDLGSRAAVGDVYAACHDMLPPGGVLLNGDFIKPDGTDFEYEAGRFEAELHLDLLRQAGFAAPVVLAQFEREIVAPTAAQNYACFLAVK